MSEAGLRRKRSYNSTRRAEQAAQTRSAVVSAATELFARSGWAATGMRDIAAAAGVAVETVYSHFRSKSELLAAAIDAAVVGDLAEVPLAQRPEFASLAEGTPAQRVAAGAFLQAQILLRSAALNLAFRQAAAGDADLERRLAESEERRRESVEQALVLIAGRPVSAEERDGLWAVLSVEVWQLLTERSGWTPEEYQAWAGSITARLLGLDTGAPSPRRRTTRQGGSTS